MLGGTGWSSTIGYYKLLNELVAERLGDYHSAKILLKSIEGTINQNSNTPCVLNGTIDFQDNHVNLTISGLSNIRIVLNEAAQ